jgi:hypothetical protein
MFRIGKLPQVNRTKFIMLLSFVALAASFCTAGPFPHPHVLLKKGAGEATPVPFAGVSLKVDNETVPPGGILQFKLFLTEPRPISRGTTHPKIPALPTAGPRGIALDDPSGQACGVAVSGANGLQFNFISTNLTLGSNIDYPILTITYPVKANAPVGFQGPMTIDLGSTFLNDQNGQPYPQEITPGTLTIGGKMSITDVLPGGGTVTAGTPITILGMGFPSAPRVQLEAATVVSTKVISPERIDVTLAETVVLDGMRFRITNKATNERTTYFSYLRATPIGQSSTPLLAATFPIFSRQTYSSASLKWTRSASTFTGVALQNPLPTAAQVTVTLLSPSNQVLQTFSFALPGRTKVIRNIGEVFQAGSGGASVRMTSSHPIQALGLLGDTSAGIVVPEVVSTP